MRVWVFESNLLWSARLLQTLRAIDLDAKVAARVSEEMAEGDVAILNLGSSGVAGLAAELKQRGVKTLAHAGHKEKELLELGRNVGIDRLATNSELTFKLPELLKELSASEPVSGT
ncbi:MAG: hypothetical protein ACOYON_03590 [Fimbriimonas sp.]